jgi:hypothetical protein
VHAQIFISADGLYNKKHLQAMHFIKLAEEKHPLKMAVRDAIVLFSSVKNKVKQSTTVNCWNKTGAYDTAEGARPGEGEQGDDGDALREELAALLLQFVASHSNDTQLAKERVGHGLRFCDYYDYVLPLFCCQLWCAIRRYVHARATTVTLNMHRVAGRSKHGGFGRGRCAARRRQRDT